MDGDNYEFIIRLPFNGTKYETENIMILAVLTTSTTK